MSPNKNNISAPTTNLWEESEVTQTPTQTPEAKRRSLEAMNAIIQELQKQLADLREEVAKISRHNGQDIVYIKQPIIPTIQLDRTADVEDAI
jgi:Tfp pilus assembly protein FimV